MTMIRFTSALLAAWLLVPTGLCAAGQNEASGPSTVPVRCLAFSPDGSQLAAAGSSGTTDGRLMVWNVDDWRPRWRRDAECGFPQLAFSPDGAILALSRFAPETRLLDARTGKLLRDLEGHQDHARSVAFTPDGQRIITGSYDRTVKIWRVADGQLLRTLEGFDEPIYSLAVSPDAGLLAIAVARKGEVQLWDLSNQLTRDVIESLGSLVPHVGFSPDGKWLTVASWTGHLTIYDATSLEYRMTVEPGGGVHWAEFSPNQNYLAVATNAPQIHVFPSNVDVDEETRRSVNRLLDMFDDDSYELRERAMEQLRAIGPRATKQLCHAMQHGSAEVRWRARELYRQLGQPDAAIELDGQDEEFECVTFSPDGQLLAAGDKGGNVFVWNVGDWDQVKRLKLERKPD